jgi:phosphatidylglycerol:prolipoprotein diacylglycerol transferase
MVPNIHLGFFSIHTFGLMMWLAAVAAAFVMDRSFRRARVTVKDQGADAMTMVAIALVAGIIGAKLWHVIDTPLEFRELGWRVLWDTAGFAWFGGLAFGISALLFQGWWAKIGALRTLDLAAPAAAIGYGIGRIGCFLSGDGCYGIAIQPVHLLSFTFTPWGMAFPHGIEPVFVPVYPTPLYELAAGLLIGAWLWWRAGKPQPTGAIVGQYLLLTGAARFLVEFLRRNPKVLWGLSNAQLASAASVLAGILLIAWAATRPACSTNQA